MKKKHTIKTQNRDDKTTYVRKEKQQKYDTGNDNIKPGKIGR